MSGSEFTLHSCAIYEICLYTSVLLYFIIKFENFLIDFVFNPHVVVNSDNRLCGYVLRTKTSNKISDDVGVLFISFTLHDIIHSSCC